MEHKFLVFPGIFQVLFFFFKVSLFSSKQDLTDVHVSEEKVLSYQQPLSKLVPLHPALKVTFEDYIPQTAYRNAMQLIGMLCSTYLLYKGKIVNKGVKKFKEGKTCLHKSPIKRFLTP